MEGSRGAPDGSRPGLRTALSTPENKARYVRRLFSTIARRYDLITVLLSYGQDRRWKRRLLALAQVRPGTSALDLASSHFAVLQESDDHTEALEALRDGRSPRFRDR